MGMSAMLIKEGSELMLKARETKPAKGNLTNKNKKGGN